MIALAVLIVICALVFGFIGWLFNLNDRNLVNLMTWGSTITVCVLLIYIGCF